MIVTLQNEQKKKKTEITSFDSCFFSPFFVFCFSSQNVDV